MKIGFLVNPNCAISGMSNGILKQATVWAEGLRALGYEVDFIGPSQDGVIRRIREYDVVHFFQHGHWLKGFPASVRHSQKWFFSPILDSTASIPLYAALAKIPVEHYLVSFGPRLLRNFSMNATVSVRSRHEKEYMSAIAPKAKIEHNYIALTLEDGASIKPSTDLPQQFALFVGNIAAERKNVYRLIKACDQAGIPLVLAGIEVDCAEMRRIKKCIEEARIDVLRLGFVSKEELRWLYSSCNVFCLPSMVEGVGQVGMEALYFGAPVVVTKVGGPPDYFGKYADYVNPNSVTSIERGICSALNRKVALSLVREHLQKFSIQNTARNLLDSYNK